VVVAGGGVPPMLMTKQQLAGFPPNLACMKCANGEVPGYVKA